MPCGDETSYATRCVGGNVPWSTGHTKRRLRHEVPFTNRAAAVVTYQHKKIRKLGMCERLFTLG